MARMFSQVFESTNATFTFLHSSVTKGLNAAEKGSMTRAWDSLDVVQVALCVMLVCALAFLGFVVYSLATERSERKTRAMSCNAYMPDVFSTEIVTRNLRNH